MTAVTFAKVTTLPATPANSAMYFVPSTTTGVAKAYITSSAGVPWQIAPLTSSAPPLVSSATSLAGTSDNYARADHSHGIGVIPATATCSTQAVGNSSSALASTAFVMAAVNPKANLASPTFTGVPAAPTAAPGTNTTQLATTAFVAASLATAAANWETEAW